MPRLSHTYDEWRAIATELAAPGHDPAPPGLLERVRALLREAPADWSSQVYVLELDEGSAGAVRAAQAALAGRDPASGQRAASVAEAEAIVRDHQRRG